MKLLAENELVWSWVVANSKMNRERNSNHRTRILECKDPRQIDFALTCKGASDEAGPNYTGQDAVCSVYAVWYSLLSRLFFSYYPGNKFSFFFS